MQSKLFGFALLAALAVDYRDTKVYEVTLQYRAVPLETVYQGYSGCNVVYYTNHFVNYESIRVTNYAK